MACYVGLYGILNGPTKSTDHPSKGPSTQIKSIFPRPFPTIPSIETIYTSYVGPLDTWGKIPASIPLFEGDLKHRLQEFWVDIRQV